MKRLPGSTWPGKYSFSCPWGLKKICHFFLCTGLCGAVRKVICKSGDGRDTGVGAHLFSEKARKDGAFQIGFREAAHMSITKSTPRGDWPAWPDDSQGQQARKGPGRPGRLPSPVLVSNSKISLIEDISSFVSLFLCTKTVLQVYRKMQKKIIYP